VLYLLLSKVEDEGLLKDLVVIFIFLGMLCTVRCFFFSARVLFAKSDNIFLRNVITPVRYSSVC
jgi:hypothetical protein